MAWISKLALLPLLASASQVAQGQDTVPVIRTETRAVLIDVAARESHGAPVRGLTKDDFKLLDDGKPRAIAFFSAETGEPVPDADTPGGPLPAPSIETPPASLPRVLSNAAPPNVPHEPVTVILLDASSPTLDAPFSLPGGGKMNNGGVGSGYLAQARNDAIDVMAKLPVKERIAIYQISPGGLKIVQDFTTDRDLLRKSIKAWSIPIDWKPICGPTVEGLAQPIALGPGAKAPGDNPEADAVAAHGCQAITEDSIRMGAMSVLDSLRVIGEKLARQPGRKSLIWVTPGFPMRWLRGMDTQSQEALAELNDANVALNAIDVRGVGPGLNDPQVTVMQSMTEATGGKTYLQNEIGGQS
jgi:VWFA-related protein